MEPFESHIGRNGYPEIELLNTGERFTMGSPQYVTFSFSLIEELEQKHPTVLLAVEEKLRKANKQLFAVMKENKRLYVQHVTHTVCACCFGELDNDPDFDGENFNMEYPRQCRDLILCPWNGYSERNKDSFMVICGAKHEFGFTPQERKVAKLIQSGKTNYEELSGLMDLSYASIHKFIGILLKKTGTSSTAELSNFLKNKRI